MDGASAAASIIAIATAGIQTSIKLVTISSQLITASERVSTIANDVSLTASILQQLGDLMKQDSTDSHGPGFSREGLETVQRSALVCQTVFTKIQKEIAKASAQLRSCQRLEGGKVKLSKTEMARWPFVQPSIDDLRDNLKEAKGTLMLMLQLWLLAITRGVAQINQSMSINIGEQQDMMRAILALKAQSQLETRQDNGIGAPALNQSSDEDHPRPKDMTSKDISLIKSATPLTRTMLQGKGEVSGNETSFTPSKALDALSKLPDHRSTNGDKDVFRKLEAPRERTGFTDTRQVRSIPPLVAPLKPLPMVDVRRKSQGKINAQGENTSELSFLEVKVDLRDNMVDPKGGAPSIKLVWRIQDLNLEQSIIRDRLDELKSRGRSSLIETIENLHDHERFMLEKVLEPSASRPKGTIMGLKRTDRDGQYKGVIFQQIPGLQMVIQRKLSQHSGRTSTLSSMMTRLGAWRPSLHTKAKISAVELKDDAIEAFDMTMPGPDKGVSPIEPNDNVPTYPPRPTISHRPAPGTALAWSGPPTSIMSPGSAFGSLPPGGTSGVAFDDRPNANISIMEYDEARAVDDLLKSYTTLFDTS